MTSDKSNLSGSLVTYNTTLHPTKFDLIPHFTTFLLLSVQFHFEALLTSYLYEHKFFDPIMYCEITLKTTSFDHILFKSCSVGVPFE